MVEGVNKLETACRDFEEDLVLYYYGEVLEAERSRVEGHLKLCLRCRRFMDDLRRLLPQMAQPREMPQAFWDGYYREMVDKLAAHQERKARWRSWFLPLQSWALPAFGTAAVAVFAFALVLGKGDWTFQPNRSQQNIPPEVLTDARQLEFFTSMDMLESLGLLEALDGSKIDSTSSQSSSESI
jgi:predicted anti-sigma-YlaC factor YlaD